MLPQQEATMSSNQLRLLIGGVIAFAFLGAVFSRARPSASPEAVFARADAAFRSGKLDQADLELGRLEELRHPNPVDRLLRGQVAFALGRSDQAVAELADVPDSHPLAPIARITAGQIEVRRGRTRPAEALFQAALRLTPGAVHPRRELVFLYNIQHRQRELDEQLTALDDLQSLDFQYVLHWSKTRNVVWNPREDLPKLEKFVAADPDDRWSR